MYIDSLLSDKGPLCVGITAVRNEHELDGEQLIAIGVSQNKEVLAVQLFNASKIVDVHHLLAASQNALNAWRGDYAKSRSLDVEIAVYASGQRQIGRALESIGVSNNLTDIGAVIIAEREENVLSCLEALVREIGAELEDPFPADRDRLEMIMKYFEIEPRELNSFVTSGDTRDLQNALSRCVASRVSMVALDT